MNDESRAATAAQLQHLENENTLANIADEVRQIAEVEREKWDNMSESFPDSPALEALEEAADALEEAADKLQEASDTADEAAELIRQITGDTH